MERPPRADRCSRSPFPELTVEPGVFVPAEPSHMTWRYLFREGIGAHQRCLDVGCGTGLLGIQLALNGAAHVLAVDIDQRAVANTLGNAFRNGVSDRLTAQVVDLYPWVPEERYECIVSCLYQRPTDPFREAASHRWGDYWGRNGLDQLIGKLPEALAPEGVAYVVQFSIASQQRTAELLAEAGLRAQVVDYTVFDFPRGFEESAEQIRRVEQLSDAYHLRVGEDEAMVAYLLEIRHDLDARPRGAAGRRAAGAAGRARPRPGSGRAAGGRRPAERHRRARAPEAAEALGLGRVLLSRIHDAALVAEALHAPGARRSARGAARGARGARLSAARGRGPAAAATAAGGGRRAEPLRVRRDHGLARLRGRADPPRGPRDRLPARGSSRDPEPGRAAVTELDRDALARFAEGFALVFERAVLRRRLRVQREELRQFASWADARVGELSDGVIDLTPDRRAAAEVPERPEADPRLRDLLTRREVDVLEHMVRGETNADIARALVVSEGTVKFHVKNILRKLNASNRAEATSRYMRLSLRSSSARG